MASVTGVLLAGCGEDSTPPAVGETPPPTPPIPTSPPTPVDPEVAAEPAVLDAYRCMWESYDRAGRPPVANPQDESLVSCATGSALLALVDGLTEIRERGQVIDGTVVLNPEVVELSLETSPPRAQVRDCADSTEWLLIDQETGEVSDDPRGRQLIVADLEEDSGAWKVGLFAVREVGSCG